MWIIGGYILEGLFLMLLARPLIKRRVKPNRFYGFRTPKTLSSPAIWYPANEFSGRRLFSTGVIVTISSLLLAPLTLFGPIGLSVYTYAMVTILLLSLFSGIIASFRYLKRL
ncbi:MAG: SdpI/YhfL protein family [Chthonomonadaceae bacterium]|nr:SdpI/YhfL protein family [Chthonomonadaceae bacterium]